MKHVTIGAMLTDEQVKQAIAVFTEHRGDSGGCVAKIREAIIAPNLEAINGKLGQENDASYLAYAVYYAMTQAEGAPE
jgi:hypothetical protein